MPFWVWFTVLFILEARNGRPFLSFSFISKSNESVHSEHGVNECSFLGKHLFLNTAFVLQIVKVKMHHQYISGILGTWNSIWLFTIHRGFLPLIQLSGEKRAVSFDLFFYVTRRHLKRIKEATYCLANNISLLLIVFKTLLTLQYIHFRLMQRTDTPLLVKVYLQQSESFLWAFWDFNVQNWFSQLDRLVPDIL